MMMIMATTSTTLMTATAAVGTVELVSTAGELVALMSK